MNSRVGHISLFAANSSKCKSFLVFKHSEFTGTRYDEFWPCLGVARSVENGGFSIFSLKWDLTAHSIRTTERKQAVMSGMTRTDIDLSFENHLYIRITHDRVSIASCYRKLCLR